MANFSLQTGDTNKKIQRMKIKKILVLLSNCLMHNDVTRLDAREECWS